MVKKSEARKGEGGAMGSISSVNSLRRFCCCNSSRVSHFAFSKSRNGMGQAQSFGFDGNSIKFRPVPLQVLQPCSALNEFPINILIPAAVFASSATTDSD